MDIQNVKAAVDELGRTWKAFRVENDRRSGRSEAALTKINARMDCLEAAIRRAGRTRQQDSAERDYGPEAKAYFDYLRHGTRDEPNARRDVLSREDMKALTVGDAAFARALDKVVRVANGDDIAPRYPLPLGYRHGGAAWHLKDDGRLLPGAGLWQRIARLPVTPAMFARAVQDHGVEEYRRKLQTRAA